ncbi:MAG: hypothetical protein C0410_12925 [Anaerolinea sp.]|nr:hypothetical protein [Anaerolinea sp.]
MTENKTITYVEFFVGGHTSIWICSVVEAFERLKPGYKLVVWVQQDFLEVHKSWCSQFIRSDGLLANDITFKVLEVAGWDKISYPPHPLKVIRRCAEEDKAEVCCVALNLEGLMRDIAFSPPWATRVKIVGALQGPFLHYIKFSSARSRKGLTVRKYLSAYIKTLIVSHRQAVTEILMHDPLAPSFYNAILKSSKFRFLPDYTIHIEVPSKPRKQFDLPEDKVIILFPGAIEQRKGVFEFLIALKKGFEQNSGFRKKVAIVFAGQVEATIRGSFYSKVSGLHDSCPDIPLFLFDQFLTDREFVTLISASDVVCMPYVHARGSSGILIHAAAYARLVVASEFGLVGELVKRYNLGVVCDESNPEELEEALCRCVDESGRMDEERCCELKTFAARYSLPLNQFGEEICASLIRAAT